MAVKLKQKLEVFKLLKESGKSTREAYKLAGYKGDPAGGAPYQINKTLRIHALTDIDLMKTGKKVAKHILEIAEEELSNARKNGVDKDLKVLCIKSALAIIQDQQDRIDPKKNVSVNTNISAKIGGTIDFSQYKRVPAKVVDVSNT